MSVWDKTRKYLLFYAGDEKIIPRRDIRNQLYDAVREGNRLQERSQLLDIANRRLNDLAMKQTKALQKLDDLIKAVGGDWHTAAYLIEIKDLLEGKK